MISIRFLVFVAILGVPLVARADFGMSMFNAASSAAINIAGTTAINAAIGQAAKNATSSQTNNQNPTVAITTNTLRYKPSPEISDQLKERFWNTIKQNNPQSAAEIDTSLKDQDVIGTFNTDMAPYGLRADDVGDTLTAYWITMWMIANTAPIPDQEQVKAARNQVGDVIIKNDLIALEDDTQKQTVAETLIYETMLALGMRHQAVESGNQAQITELADAAYSNMLKQDIDLRALKLTSLGFITR